MHNKDNMKWRRVNRRRPLRTGREITAVFAERFDPRQAEALSDALLEMAVHLLKYGPSAEKLSGALYVALADAWRENRECGRLYDFHDLNHPVEPETVRLHAAVLNALSDMPPRGPRPAERAVPAAAPDEDGDGWPEYLAACS